MERKSNLAIKPEVPEGPVVEERLARIETTVTHLRTDVDRVIATLELLRAESSAHDRELTDLRQQMTKQGHELQEQVSKQGHELQEQVSKQGHELQEQISKQGHELQEQVSKQGHELQEQMTKQDRELQQQLTTRDRQLNVKYEELKREILRVSLTDRIWMLLLTGTVLAVMAHGFKWL